MIGAALIGAISACAPKTVPLPPVAVSPQFPEYIKPTPPAELTGSPAAQSAERAWQYLQAGDLRGADREAGLALKAQPTFYPALTTSAYIALARKDAKDAVSQFSKVTDTQPEYVPALAGKGMALLAVNRSADALEAFREAVRVDPSLTELARQVDVLTLRGLQDELTAARQAARSGQPEAALRAYRNAIAASPDSAFLYREIAGIERQQGQLPSAVDHLRRATSLDPSDTASLVLLGDLLDQQGDTDGAIAAYTDAVRLEGDPAVDAKRGAIRARLELAALPAQYRAIDDSPQITRADLAALIGVRLSPLVQSAPARDVSVVTDIRGHWAEPWIAPVARAGIVEAFANHTFQPNSVVRRADLAQAAARLLNVIAASDPAAARAWAGARGRFTDLPPAHLAYQAASVAAAANVVPPVADGRFLPSQVVSGAEAIAAIDRVRAIANLPRSPAGNR
jgi:tetratricopeptide (TPR) repeat protein